ncbi:sorting nexin-10A isoform X2 [Thunnus albacares]|uniref:sorting nexin-10A isoform X2 n=1 Tax=Thunnus maccoyii TaxID=8240 RepID=UPI001C4CCD22|nr:sorting nexin-10A isoform X2 [Thunnus maccoyii]XP_044192630.1 sorting nexin-10A isoform X2 [Thunnus albacares]
MDSRVISRIQLPRKVFVPTMDSMLDSLSKTEFISVCLRDPRLHKDDLWHTHVDYEICLHTSSMCFRKKTSRVRRRYSEFVWLRHCLEQNALTIELPKLPPWNPFFSLRNTGQVTQRMRGLQEFLEIVLHTPLLLSDSRLHLFLQSDLSLTKIERCALGKTRYTVAEAIQRSSSGYVSRLEDKASCDSDCESSSSSGFGLSVDTAMRESPLPFLESPDKDPELFSCLSESPTKEQLIEP